MSNGVDNKSAPADMTTAAEFGGLVDPARPISPAEQALSDWLETTLAAETRLAHDGTAEWKYQSVYELIAAYGRWFTPAALPTGVRVLPERQCFVNAAETELEHPGLAYIEGLALGGDSPLPTLHAWCADGDGQVIDPTWSELGGSAYLGIALPSALRPQGPRYWGVLEAPNSLYSLLRSGL
ncbi:hypothetical protein ACFFSH_31310 [Streptomyces filamentosus]|uniref:Uncharacterized protein n=1 Tax=Streptomyces filamentosus TaxID=67294 RepID=A0A919BUX8_STRFL|nr:hypothetical protein [Streptomyces filamentosus]GHG14068.1 hypothetical protein GCM10017667_55300 [Streptomyces filamentosus]